MRILKNYKMSCFIFIIASMFCCFTTIKTFAVQTTITNTYDDLNRLETVDQSDGITYDYDYDEVGNIVADLDSDTTYYWKVVAKDSNGDTIGTSETRYFTTE